MTKKTIIYLVRHGESEHNKNGLLAGHIDTPLTEAGEEQARQAKRKLSGIHFDTAYSSDLQRAIQTGEIIYGKPIPEAHRLPALRERTYGSLEDTPELWDHQSYISKMAALSREAKWHYKEVDDMETDHEMSMRFLEALETIAQNNYGKTVLVANHGGTIRTLLMKLQNLNHDDWPPGSFRNGDYAQLEYTPDKGFTVISLNGTKI